MTPNSHVNTSEINQSTIDVSNEVTIGPRFMTESDLLKISFGNDFFTRGKSVSFNQKAAVKKESIFLNVIALSMPPAFLSLRSQNFLFICRKVCRQLDKRKNNLWLEVQTAV